MSNHIALKKECTDLLGQCKLFWAVSLLFWFVGYSYGCIKVFEPPWALAKAEWSIRFQDANQSKRFHLMRRVTKDYIFIIHILYIYIL